MLSFVLIIELLGIIWTQTLLLLSNKLLIWDEWAVQRWHLYLFWRGFSAVRSTTTATSISSTTSVMGFLLKGVTIFPSIIIRRWTLIIIIIKITAQWITLIRGTSSSSIVSRWLCASTSSLGIISWRTWSWFATNTFWFFIASWWVIFSAASSSSCVAPSWCTTTRDIRLLVIITWGGIMMLIIGVLEFSCYCGVWLFFVWGVMLHNRMIFFYYYVFLIIHY